jgi:RND family efflux transporter MFP subunit
MIMKIKKYLAIGLMGTLLPACGPATQEAPPEASPEPATLGLEITEAQRRQGGIELGRIEPRSLSGRLRVSGRVEVPPQNLVNLNAKMGGFVKSTDLLPGLRVRKGQVLAQIENQEYIGLQQDYLEGQGRLTYLQAEYQRQQQLSTENVSAQKVFQQVAADYASLQARLKATEARLRLVGADLEQLRQGNLSSTYPLVAPVGGVVTAVNLNLGKAVTAQEVLAQITDPSHLHVVLTVFDPDIPKLREGQALRLTLANQPGRELAARIFLINPQVRPDRSIEVHCHLAAEDASLPPNAYLTAEVELAGATVPALPNEAFVSEAGSDYIFVAPARAQAGKWPLEMVKVGRGLSDGQYTEVVLPPGTLLDRRQVVVKGAFTLLSQMKVSGEEEE